MKIKLYQIAPEEEQCSLLYCNFQVSAKGKQIDASHYECVYEGEFQTVHPEIIYEIFNTNLLSDYRGRSMTTSDVLEIEENGKIRFLFCDSFGFKKCKFDTTKVLPTAECRKQREVRNGIMDIADAQARFLEETQEYNAVSYFLGAVKIDDMELSFEDGMICAVDSYENRWNGKELYEFLLNEVVMLRADMTLVDGLYMDSKILADVVALAQKYGAEIHIANSI